MNRMTKKMSADLKKTANISASTPHIGNRFICNAMKIIGAERNDWKQTEEARMIDPNQLCWWNYDDNQSRLIGIAMMVTMPIEIIEHKCAKK